MFEEITYSYPEESERLWKRIEKHYKLFDRTLLRDVQSIFDRVEQEGDKAVYEATQKFDQVHINNILVTDRYITECVDGLTDTLRTAIEKAIENIREVNQVLMPPPFWQKEIREGTFIGEKTTALEKVGLWIPARKGPLVSTALMLTVAAKVAGVKEIIVGMSPRSNGLGDPATIAAAKLAGADTFVVGNGVGIIAGLSIGTAEIPEVDGIYGPGPNAIAAAMSTAFSYGKRTVVGIGPTEGAIIADNTADPRIIAYDMISESEHGPDSSFIFVTDSIELSENVRVELRKVIDEAPAGRKQNLESVFGGNGFGAIVITTSIEAACQVINDYAPEHLLIKCSTDNEKYVLDNIRNTGEILAGNNTPFSAANYLIGITAVLPTNGFSKRFSGITCKDMIKYSSFGRLNESAITDLFPYIKALGEYEGLPCHVKEAEVRIKK